MANLGDITYNFNTDATKTSVIYKVTIDVDDNNCLTCSSGRTWSATGTNYTLTSMSGSSGEYIRFFNSYMKNEVSKWKIWSTDDPTKFFNITLIHGADESYLDSITEEISNNVSINYIIEPITETLVGNCCSEEHTIKFKAYKEIIDVDKQELKEDDYLTVLPLKKDVKISCTNKNGFGIANINGDDGIIFNDDEITVSFSSDTNCSIEDKAILNTINVTILDDTEVSSSLTYTQLAPERRTIFYSNVNSLIPNANSYNSYYNVNYEGIVVSSNACNGYFTVTHRDGYFCGDEELPISDFLYYKQSDVGDEKLVTTYSNNEKNISITNVQQNTDGQTAFYYTLTASTKKSGESKGKPTYYSVHIKSQLDDSYLSIPIAQRRYGDNGNDFRRIVVGFENYTSGKYSFGAVLMYKVRSLGETAKTVKIGYIKNEKNELEKMEACYLNIPCIPEDEFNIYIESIFVYDGDETYMVGGAAINNSTSNGDVVPMLKCHGYSYYSDSLSHAKPTYNGQYCKANVNDSDERHSYVQISRPLGFNGNFNSNYNSLIILLSPII